MTELAERRIRIVSMNNRAVALLKAGKNGAAHAYFHYALRLMMGEMEKEDVAHVGDKRARRRMEDEEMMCSQQLSPETPPTGVETESNIIALRGRLLPKSAATEFIYCDGVQILPSMIQNHDEDGLISSAIISCVLVYNLALIFHLQALHEGGSTSVAFTGEGLLSKARSLYRKSLLLLMEAGFWDASTGNPDIDMLCLVVFNNLAQSSYELALYDESRQYFEHLLHFSTTVSPDKYQGFDAKKYVSLDQARSNFLLNAIILRGPPAFACAA